MNDAVPNIEPLFDLSSLNLSDLTEQFYPDEQTANLDDEKFVVFFLDDELFAVAASQVAEVVRPLNFTPLPNSPAWLYGIANLRGEIVSVLNLSKICSKRAAPVSSKSKIIVLKPKNFASSIAFLVDRLSEIMTLKPENIQPAEDLRFFGKAVHEKINVYLLDTERLFTSLV
jgi:purine-binding chemotaxis protein CheW